MKTCNLLKKASVVLLLIMHNAIHSQVLYTENFESYPVGNIGTNLTGVTPGAGGWYTLSTYDPLYNIVPSNTEFQIVADAKKGKVAQIKTVALAGEWYRLLYRTDLKTFWQQRTPGNNVLKIAFDLYCGTSGDYKDAGTSALLKSNEGVLATISYDSHYQYIDINVDPKDKIDIVGHGNSLLKYTNGQPLKVPANSWVTFEMYVDYNNSMVYFSIPAFNYTIAKSTGTYVLDLDGNEHDDNPVRLSFGTIKGVNHVSLQPHTPKVDNINFSAQNTVPTINLSTESVLASQFTLYPNPATTVVNINSAENKPVSKVAVYDVAGKLLSTTSYNNETNIQLNTESLASGTYMLHIETAEGTAVKKLIKK